MNVLKLLIASCLFTLGVSCSDYSVQDNGRIYQVVVDRIAAPKSEKDLQELIAEARTRKVPLIASGKRHSQGAQSLKEGAISVDMNGLNQILNLNIVERHITVQAGASWADIQNAINPHGLAVRVMQSSNIFTVGGSLSVNAHGRDPRFASVIDTVEAIKFLSPDGNFRWIDRSREPELFYLAIGGYGLFGFIVEVKLQLTENALLHRSAQVMAPEAYFGFFEREIAGNNNAHLHFARFYIGPDAPLSKLIAVTYNAETPIRLSHDPLAEERNITRNKLLLSLLRKTDWAKKRAWDFQVEAETKAESISRNNAMRPPVLALNYHSKRDTDILQEYFVPVRNFLAFSKAIQEVLGRHSINLLNVTVRYTPKSNDAVMSYANEDSFAFVFYVNQGLSTEEIEKARTWTGELIDAALSLEGSFYLPYQRYATSEQLLRAYPNLPFFLEQKKRYDPEELFQSDFYTKMLRP